MINRSQNQLEIQEELLRIVEDRYARGLVKDAFNAYGELLYDSATRRKINDEVEALFEDPENRLLREANYPMRYWIGAYVLYMSPETRKLLEDYRNLMQDHEYQTEKLSQLEPKYMEVINTIDKLKEEQEQIDKKIDSINNRIYKREIKLDSLCLLGDEIKRSKTSDEIEALKKEHDNLVDRYIELSNEIDKMRKSSVIGEYLEVKHNISAIEVKKDYIWRRLYEIVEKMP
jgi:cell division protein FtsB